MLRLQVIVNFVMSAVWILLPLLKPTIVICHVLIPVIQQILNNCASPARRFTVNDYFALYFVRLSNTIFLLETVCAHVKWLWYVLCGNVNRQWNRATIFTLKRLANVYQVQLRTIIHFFNAYYLLYLLCIEWMV